MTAPLTPEREQEMRQQIAEALVRWAEQGNSPAHAAVRRQGTVVKNAYARADAVLPIVRAAVAASTKELADTSVNAANALRDERRHYEIACKENARLRAELAEARAAVAAERARALNEAADAITGRRRANSSWGFPQVTVEQCEHLLRRMAAATAREARPADPARRVLTPGEHDRAWHAIEGAAGEPGADPGTILNAVLWALRIDEPTAEDEQAASPRHAPPGPAQGEVLPCPAKHGALGRICERPAGHSGMHTGEGLAGLAVWEGGVE